MTLSSIYIPSFPEASAYSIPSPILVTIADKDKEEALPLIRRFYNLGFNIEATKGTAKFLKEIDAIAEEYWKMMYIITYEENLWGFIISFLFYWVQFKV